MNPVTLLHKYQELLLQGFQVLAKDPAWPKACEHFEKLRQNKKNLFLAGNGGSAANANHLAADLIYGVNQAGRGTFQVHSLSANPSVLTCLGNDIGYENIFSHQLFRKASKGDLCFLISASGNSQNLIRAVEACKSLGLISIGILGFDGGKLAKVVDHLVLVETDIGKYGPVEDIHLGICHAVSALVAKELSTRVAK